MICQLCFILRQVPSAAENGTLSFILEALIR
jgi:hypothetical protein